ncbi:beta-glucosidase [Agrilactobacillus composti DSM 18527 = JCM 14202]|nr:beta-glucosidase [Agrilactobacillus composti DSM 18527 = JCM 14202]
MTMKKSKKIWVPAIIIVVIVAGILYAWRKLNQDSVLNMADVYATLSKVAGYFIPLGILIVIIIAALIIFRKRTWRFKFWLKWESLLVLLVAIMVTLNVILFGPMASLLNLNYAKLDTIQAATLKDHQQLTRNIAEEGTVLLKNEAGFLPLKANTKKLNVFGWASTNPVYGGTGSGNVDTSNATSVLISLKDSGFQLNNDLSQFYTKYRKDRPKVEMWQQDWTLVEPAKKDYSNKLVSDAKNFSDTALIVISRVGGEGADLPTDMTAKNVTYKGNKGDYKKGQHFLQLSKSEKEMVQLVTSNFKDVVVLVNSANPMELGWLNQYDNIRSALWMSGPGAVGFSALGDILTGKVNPSGRLVDTYVYDLKKTPTWHNFGDFKYQDSKYTRVDYAENIYVGYKFYETYYQNNEAGYRDAVQYALGYGLSYTNFTQEMSDLRQGANGKVEFDVTVTNTGQKAGKDVVQTYFQPPYENGGVEKAATNLLTFTKTKTLAPGASQKLTISFNQEQLAAYDEAKGGAYVLASGDYGISLNNNAHEIATSKTLNVPTTITYDQQHKRLSDKIVAKNQFANFTRGEVTYLSRQDNFANLNAATAAPEKRALTALEKNGLTNDKTYKIKNNSQDKMPKTDANNNLALQDLRNKKYNDPKWDKLLDQMTIKDMSNLITYGGYQTVAAKSVAKGHTYDFDGPAGISSFFVDTKGTAFPTATMIAATWNQALAKQRGQAVGQEANQLGISGWYGPAMNIHRSAFAGRNFEYYSEDGTLSGMMAAQETIGAKSQGVYAYLKHFALNDQETNRGNMLLTWSTEQAIREIYLKPFELAVKEGGATAVMSAFNYVGNQWAGGSTPLLKNVLRSEWGFNGLVLTDYFSGLGYMDADKAVRNGNDMMLSTTGESGAGLNDTKSATAVKAMRSSAHNILYTVVNSRTYAKSNAASATENLPWQKTVTTINIIAGLVLLAIQGLVIWLYRRKNKKSA